MPDGVQLRGPADGIIFGASVAMNQEFIVVSGRPNLHVYQSSNPYNLVAKFPIASLSEDSIDAIVISDDNTIATSHVDKNDDYWLIIYQYDGTATWHIAEKFHLASRIEFQLGSSLAVQGDFLVVGDLENSKAQVFNRVGVKWVQGQTIKEDSLMFGSSVTIYGDHLAVSSFYGDVFTYMLDQHTNTWVGNGNFSVQSAFFSSLHLDKDILAITVNNPWNRPDVCGVVYKLSTTATNTNNGNVVTTTITGNTNVVWKEIALLTTKGDPVTTEHHQGHVGIRKSCFYRTS